MSDTFESNPKTTLHIKLDWRVVSGVLLAVIVVMLYMWQPWHTAKDKTISVRGEATVQAVSDVFVFQPIYEDADIKQATATGNEAVAHLKQLGVKDADIKTSVMAAGKSDASPISSERYTPKSSYSITITVRDKMLAQKVTDYLATTSAIGQVTPNVEFDKATRSRLDLEARRQASADAKTKAEVMVKQFGGRLGKVTKINEDPGRGFFGLEAKGSADAARPTTAANSPIVEPGTSELTYSFTVDFELK